MLHIEWPEQSLPEGLRVYPRDIEKQSETIFTNGLTAANFFVHLSVLSAL